MKSSGSVKIRGPPDARTGTRLFVTDGVRQIFAALTVLENALYGRISAVGGSAADLILDVGVGNGVQETRRNRIGAECDPTQSVSAGRNI